MYILAEELDKLIVREVDEVRICSVVIADRISHGQFVDFKA